ncbi:hypothetical protein [Streptomyces clavuligerus]|uniref:hypothetical protein n=1 Tax=Streptomyces clavuligerus TaxID=1901 RepID=UPI001E2FCB24|nr:hypothetical protein [Streptomyces clavuligerus]
MQDRSVPFDGRPGRPLPVAGPRPGPAGPPGQPPAPPRGEGVWAGRWQMDHDGWHGELVIDPAADGAPSAAGPSAGGRLGDYRRAGRRYDVHGFTVQHGRGLRFWVADTADQEFQAYLCGGDAGRAAGWTDWRGTPFGLSLSRVARPGPPAQGFTAADWQGVWLIYHDGRCGRLDIASVRPFSAEYTPGTTRVRCPPSAHRTDAVRTSWSWRSPSPAAAGASGSSATPGSGTSSPATPPGAVCSRGCGATASDRPGTGPPDGPATGPGRPRTGSTPGRRPDRPGGGRT